MNIASIGKTVGEFENHIMTCLKNGVDLKFNQNTTNADIANWEAQCTDIFKSGSQDISNEAYAQMQEGATNHLIDRGVSKEEAERITKDTLKKIIDFSENVRQELPAVERAIKFGWLKFVGFVTLAFAGIMTLSMFSRDPRMDNARKESAFLKHVQQEQELAEIPIDASSMGVMISGLVTAPSAPQQAPPIAVASIPYVPPAVAAIAAQPATATITTQGSTQTVQTTVGQIYRYAPPPVRRFMAPPSPPPEEEEDPGEEYHNSFTVDSGFASISVSY